MDTEVTQEAQLGSLSSYNSSEESYGDMDQGNRRGVGEFEIELTSMD